MTSIRMCFNMLCLIVLLVPVSAKRMKVYAHHSSQNTSDATQTKSAGDKDVDGPMKGDLVNAEGHPSEGKDSEHAREIRSARARDREVEGEDVLDGKNWEDMQGLLDEGNGDDLEDEEDDGKRSTISIVDDLAKCPRLPQDVHLVFKIFELDTHWKTVADQDAEQCSDRCGKKVGNIPARLTREDCCKVEGQMVVSARLMTEAGAGVYEIPSLSIGNLCSDPDPKTGYRSGTSGVMRSVGANIAVYQQLKLMTNIQSIATELGDAKGALAHIAWVFANCQEPTAEGCYNDVVATKLEPAWKNFLGGSNLSFSLDEAQTGFEKDSFLRNLKADETLQAFANAWATLDCEGEQVCSNGIQSDKDKVQDIVSGRLDLSALP